MNFYGAIDNYESNLHQSYRNTTGVSVSAVEDLFSKVLTELLPRPDPAQHPPTGRARPPGGSGKQFHCSNYTEDLPRITNHEELLNKKRYRQTLLVGFGAPPTWLDNSAYSLTFIYAECSCTMNTCLHYVSLVFS